jgi:hypothetical protein
MKSLDIPSVIFPNESGIYKHIQVTIRGKDLLRFELTAYIHGEMLENLLKTCGVEFQYKRVSDEEIIPLKKGVDYELVGAGRAKINLENRSCEFYKFSHHYQIRTNEAHLERINKNIMGWDMKKIE